MKLSVFLVGSTMIVDLPVVEGVLGTTEATTSTTYDWAETTLNPKTIGEDFYHSEYAGCCIWLIIEKKGRRNKRDVDELESGSEKWVCTHDTDHFELAEHNGYFTYDCTVAGTVDKTGSVSFLKHFCKLRDHFHRG